MAELLNKVIIVTGAGSGVGRAAAEIFSRQGAKIVAVDVNGASAEGIAQAITAGGGICKAFTANIGSEADVIAMVDFAVSSFGRIDGGFNNAGIPQTGALFHELSAETWARAQDINLTGTFFCVKYQILAMLETGGGSIVNTASALGVVGMPRAAEYTASKHGIIGLTKGAAIDCAQSGIRVNAILPGVIRTPMIETAINANPELRNYINSVHPMGRIAEPGEIAEMAAWLLSDAASFVTGASMSVDGGYISH